MRVLVIGGTGFNGRRIVRRLLDHGHDVTVVTRGELPTAWSARVAQIRLDRKDSAAFAAACGDLTFDAVIDNIAYRPLTPASALEVFGSRIGQYLFTSTMAVYHDLLRRTCPIAEDEADLDFGPDPTQARDGAPPDPWPCLCQREARGRAGGGASRCAVDGHARIDDRRPGRLGRRDLVVDPADSRPRSDPGPRQRARPRFPGHLC